MSAPRTSVPREEAPPPGWYPAPTGGSSLWWWDGLDWSDHRRPPPTRMAPLPDVPTATRDHAEAGARDVQSASQLRARAARDVRRSDERQVAAAVEEARRVARTEVDRAVTEATRHLTEAREQLVPRLEGYVARLRRWSRLTVVVVVVLVALSAWVNATTSVGLLEWLGQRIDAVTAVALPTAGGFSLARPGGTVRAPRRSGHRSAGDR